MRRCVDAGTNSLTLRFAGALRADIAVGDLSLLFEQLQAVQIGDAQRTVDLRHRYLTLLLDALHGPGSSALPGPAPRWDEISGRYRR
jgi:hypothetical protein